MDEQLLQALMASSLSALGAALQAWRILANNGLVSPDEVDEMAHTLTGPFGELHGNLAAEKIQAVFDAVLAPALAELHRSAKANWKPPATRA